MALACMNPMDGPKSRCEAWGSNPLTPTKWRLGRLFPHPLKLNPGMTSVNVYSLISGGSDERRLKNASQEVKSHAVEEIQR